MVKAICNLCQEEFEAKRASKAYCCDAHRQMAYNNRKKMSDLREPIEQKKAELGFKIIREKYLDDYAGAIREIENMTVNDGIEFLTRDGIDKLLAQHKWRWDEKNGIWQYYSDARPIVRGRWRGQ